MEVDLPVNKESPLSSANILQTTSTDVYSDSDDTYDILVDNLNNNSRKSTCRCIVCVDRREARKDRKKKKREEKRRKRAEKQGKKIKINGFSAS